MTIVTKESLQGMLDSADEAKQARIIGRALVVIFKNQTDDEKSANTTNQNNGRGFTGADAFGGSLTAKYFMRHGTLLDWQVAKWMKPAKSGYARICKYYSQLDVAASARADVSTARIGQVM